MSQEERTGFRDRSYSAWHRINSTKRFVGIENAQCLAMIDIDVPIYVEYEDGNGREKEIVALIETARDVGQSFKTASVLRSLAKRGNIPAFVVLYKVGSTPNPADPSCMDIESFRVRRIWPNETPFHTLSPLRWSEALLRIRRNQAALMDEEDGDPFHINRVAAVKSA